MQGVSINIFIKSGKNKNKELGQIFHAGLQGKRELKYDLLNQNSLKSVKWNLLEVQSPNYFFVKKDFVESKEEVFRIDELFQFYNSGLTTEFDELAIQETKAKSELVLNALQTKNAMEVERTFQLGINKVSKIENSIKDISSNHANIKSIYYRPFDYKYAIYTGKTNGLMGRPRNDLMQHFFSDNVGIVIGRQGQAVGSMEWNVITITNTIVDCNIFYRGRGTVFPLYVYNKSKQQQSIDEKVRTPNLNAAIVKKFADNLSLTFTPEKELESEVCFANNSELRPEYRQSFAPIDLLDYIYAVLHSPTYREKYKEFLKIDFPRIPFPKDAKFFWQLVQLGGELRQVHLLESPVVDDYITGYPIDGDNLVIKVRFEPNYEIIEGDTVIRMEPLYEMGRVYINETQFFQKVPKVAWEFYIGGYQPAQKWLKDRKGRKLEFDDILHYQKIIIALFETDRLMREIDKVGVEQKEENKKM